MRAIKERSTEFTQPADAVLAAAIHTVEQGGYQLGQRDDAQAAISFQSGKSAFSWGQEFVVRVTPSGAGSTLHVICGGHDDAPRALLDGWKSGKAADKFVAAVREQLAA